LKRIMKLGITNRLHVVWTAGHWDEMSIRVLPEMWQNLEVRYIILEAREAKSDVEAGGCGGKGLYERRRMFSTLGREEGCE
jgi:hypothetical protein